VFHQFSGCCQFSGAFGRSGHGSSGKWQQVAATPWSMAAANGFLLDGWTAFAAIFYQLHPERVRRSS
jgi:hypothetical protein